MKKKKRNETKKRRPLGKNGKKATPDRKSLQLSLCMMVKNEEEMLPRCLASIKDHVDEIIIVDTGSTDRTVEIAESFGARVYNHPWKNNFSLHRNQAISYARGRWIIHLDADEEYIPPEEGSLRQATIQADKNGIDAMGIRLENIMSGGTGRSASNLVRLYRNNGVIHFRGIIHENLTGLKKIGPSPGTLIHCGYDLGRETAEKKFERTATLLRKQIAEDPDNPTPRMYLASCHDSLERHDDTAEEALIAIRLVEEQSITNIIFVRAYYAAVRALTAMERLDEALEVCRKSEARFGDQVDLLAAETGIHMRRKDWHSAIAVGERYCVALERYREGQDRFSLVDVNTYGDEWIVRAFMAEARLKLGDAAVADELFRLGLESSPDPGEYCRRAGLAFFSSARPEEARRYLEQARGLDGGDKRSVAEALFRIAFHETDVALKKRSLADMLAQAEPSAEWSRWMHLMAEFAVSRGDAPTALELLNAISREDENHLEAQLKLCHYYVYHDLFDSALSHSENVLDILDLPLGRPPASLEELARLFSMIGGRLEELDQPGNAAIARDIERKLSGPEREGEEGPPREDGAELGLSACLMVKNEETMLARCLASIRDEVDEIVVVDTGSTDRTVEIAESFGARVYHHPWENNFSLHRNQSISYAQGRWVFIIDADEEYVPSRWQSLRQEIARAAGQGLDSLILRVDNSQSDGTGRVAVESIRLFRNNGAIRYEGIVHNNLVGATRAGRILGSIIHYGYDRGEETARQKFARTAPLLRARIAEDPENPLPRMYLACAHESVEEREETLREALASIDLVEKQGITDPVYVRAFYAAVRALVQEQRLDQALEICRKSQTRFGDQVDILAAMARINLLKEDWKGVLEAGARYREALARYRNRRDGFTQENVATLDDEWVVCGWMADAALKTADIGNAVLLLATIAKADEDNLEARLKLSHILISHHMIEEALPHCDGLLRILDLPRDLTLESLADLAYLFRRIADELDERDRQPLAAIARDMEQRLLQPAQEPARHLH